MEEARRGEMSESTDQQITSMPCKMTLVTLRAANCKLLKVL